MNKIMNKTNRNMERMRVPDPNQGCSLSKAYL